MTTRRYFAEFNRVLFDNVKRAVVELKKHGIVATVLPHKTSLLLERPPQLTWKAFKKILHSILQPKRGSMILFSEFTGKTYICQNAGNQPGIFVLQ